jgi:hypothetical protein
MARRIKRVTIADPKSRDDGKTFILTEMPADQAEWWAARAFLALTNAGAEVPEGAQAAGMAGFAIMGVQALYQLRAEILKPLLDEMFECVRYEHDQKHAPQPIQAGQLSQIEEVATRLKLRLELLELHTGFSGLGAQLTSALKPQADPLPGLPIT